MHAEAKAAGLLAFRRKLNAGEGPKVSPQRHPGQGGGPGAQGPSRINCSTDGEKITLWREIHIGLAMDLGEGLLVPKVRPDQKGSGRSAPSWPTWRPGQGKEDSTRRAGPGHLHHHQPGAWGVDHFTPIVNPPESAILGVGRIADHPVVEDGALKNEPRLALSLTIDHRSSRGPGAAFLATLRRYLEDPLLMLE